MVPQNQKNKFNLSGSQLQSHLQSKPRKPMGQNAPQPIGNSGQPNTSGVQIDRNAMNAAKAPSFGDPTKQFANRQAAIYGASPNTNSIMQNHFGGQGKLPGDMGIYGVPGSMNRNAAEDKYRNFQGPAIGKGPYNPDPNANPKDNIQLLGGKAMEFGPQPPKAPHELFNEHLESQRADHKAWRDDFYKKYTIRGQSVWEGDPNDPSIRQNKVAGLTTEQEAALRSGQMTKAEWEAIRDGSPSPQQAATQAQTPQQTKLNGDRPWEVNPWHEHVGEQHSISRGLKPGEGVDNTPTDVEIERRSRATDPDSVKLGYNIPRYLEEERGWLGMTKKEFDALPARRGRTQQQSPADPAQPEGRAPAAAANPNINLQEMFYGPNSRANALNAQDAAMAPKPAPSQPQSIAPTAPTPTPAAPAPTAPSRQSSQPVAPVNTTDQQYRDFYGDQTRSFYSQYQPQPAPSTPVPATPAQPPQDMGSTLRGLDQRLVGGAAKSDAEEYRSALGGLDQRLVPGGAALPQNPGAKKPNPAMPTSRGTTVPDGMYGPPQAGQEKRLPPMIPGLSPERQEQFDADVAMDRELGMKRAAEEQKNLGFTGAINDGYSAPTNRQTDYYGERRASMDAMNKRLDEGGGLQYRQGSTGFGTPEQGTQAAADFNAMYANDKAKQDAYNTQYDATIASTRAERDARDNAQREQGIDPEAARRDINRLSGQFAAITKQGVAPGLKFVDWVQDEINSGRLSPDSDAIKIIQQNYGHKFDLTSPENSGPSIQAPSALDLARQKARDARDAGYKPGMTQAQRDGLDRRRQQAAAQGKDRSNVANLIGQGLSPYEARQEVAAANLNQQAVAADQMKQQSTLYGQVMRDQLNFNQQKELIEQQKTADRNKQVASIYQSLGPNAAIAGTPEYAQAQAMIAATQGKTPTDPTGGTTPPGGNRTPVQSQAMVSSIASRVPDEVSDINSPQAPSQIVSFAQRNGLNAKEQVDVLARVTGKPINTKEGGREYIKSLIATVDKNAAEAGKDSAGTFFQSGTKEYLAAHKNAMATQMPVITAIAEANGLTQEDINQMMDTNKYGRAKDYWDSQSGLQAYYPNFWGVANWAMGGGR